MQELTIKIIFQNIKIARRATGTKKNKSKIINLSIFFFKENAEKEFLR